MPSRRMPTKASDVVVCLLEYDPTREDKCDPRLCPTCGWNEKIHKERMQELRKAEAEGRLVLNVRNTP